MAQTIEAQITQVGEMIDTLHEVCEYYKVNGMIDVQPNADPEISRLAVDAVMALRELRIALSNKLYSTHYED